MQRNEHRTGPRGLADLLLADALVEAGFFCNRMALYWLAGHIGGRT